MTFDQWWTEEVGHPPADERERFTFEMARKAWDQCLADALESCVSLQAGNGRATDCANALRRKSRQGMSQEESSS